MEQIWLDTADSESEHSIPYKSIDKKIVHADLRRLYECLTDDGVMHKEAILKLGSMEPFNRYPELISQLK